MAINRWVYRVSDGQLMMGPSLDPSIYLTDQESYSIVTLPDADPNPSPKLHRVVNATTIRAATAQEQADYDLIVLDATVKASVNGERLIAALIWSIIDTFAAPATVTKYQAVWTKIIAAYKNQPWKS